MHKYLIKFVMLSFGWLWLMCPLPVISAPFDMQWEFVQPNGTAITVCGKGDEFYAEFRDSNGYPIVFDEKLLGYAYAELAPDGSKLISTGHLVGTTNPQKLMLDKNVKLDSKIIKAMVLDKQAKNDAYQKTMLAWKQTKAAQHQQSQLVDSSGPQFAPPSRTTTGRKIGLCLLIDFADDQATIKSSDFSKFFNAGKYKSYGNKYSIRGYFKSVSNGKLNYSNYIVGYLRMPRPKWYYNDVKIDSGTQARKMINDAIAVLKNRPDFEKIERRLKKLSKDDNNCVLAFNIYYAGGNGGVWGKGLWPHQWNLAAPIELIKGVNLYTYQVTDIGNNPKIGTVCHENGHMLCNFPDLYDYDNSSVGGAGKFCLMGSGGHGNNPIMPCAYLRKAAGWVEAIELIGNKNGKYILKTNDKKIYKYTNHNSPTEYFLFENRQQTKHDKDLPSYGIAIWHIDELGDRDNENLSFNNFHYNYEVLLMPADGQFHFNFNVNDGDIFDLFREYNNNTMFNDFTKPHARWWNGNLSGLSISYISKSGKKMTMVYEKQ